MKKDEDSKQEKATTEDNKEITQVEQDPLRAKDETMKAKDSAVQEEQPLSDSEMTSEISFGDKDE